jgi:hypothetical protein
MKITDVISDYQTLLPETYFNYAIILRQEPPSFLNRIVTFNLKNILDNPNSSTPATTICLIRSSPGGRGRGA